MADRDEIAEHSLTSFLRAQNMHEVASSIDTIVLDYLVSILQDLGSEDANEDFDTHEFIEMMSAYLPGFSDIDSGVVCDWLFKLASTLASSSQQDTCSAAAALALSSSLPVTSCRASPPDRRRSRSRSSSDNLQDTPNNSKLLPVETATEDGDIQMLMEMFPAACKLEVLHCLSISGHNTDMAAQLVIHRAEVGEAITDSQKTQGSNKADGVDKSHLKKQIIAKYSYVDVDDDQRDHKPIIPKQEGKKLTRYLDSKVVSTKGERFTEIKDPNAEHMKKTYINLKPARQYRFH